MPILILTTFTCDLINCFRFQEIASQLESALQLPPEEGNFLFKPIYSVPHCTSEHKVSYL